MKSAIINSLGNDSHSGRQWRSIAPGVALAAAFTITAQSLGDSYPFIGGAAFAIIMGALIRNVFGMPNIFEKGTAFITKKMLKLAIVLLGFSLSFAKVLLVGADSLIIIATVVVTGLSLTYVIAKAFGLTGNIPFLIGIGTAVCGATAIVTTAPILRAKEEEIAYAVNTIFGFNILAILIYPVIGHWLQLSDVYFGIWAGSAIHDTSSVVAAGYIYSDEAGNTAVIVKLIRTLSLVVIAALVSLRVASKQGSSNLDGAGKRGITSTFPYFILVFIAVVVFNSVVSLPSFIETSTSHIAKFLILMVLASVGMCTDFRKLKSVGARPFLVGLISSLIMGSLALGLIFWLI